MNLNRSIEPDLENYRAYLLVLARQQIPGYLRGRLDASDIVQETLLEAHLKRGAFRGSGSGAFGSWLRQILSGNLLDAMRAHQRQSRDVRREQQIVDKLEQSAVRLEQILAAEQTSPSGQLEQSERALQIAKALIQLPEMQRMAVELRYCQQASLEEIARSLEKSPTAVAGLLKRGIARLRELMSDPDHLREKPRLPSGKSDE